MPSAIPILLGSLCTLWLGACGPKQMRAERVEPGVLDMRAATRFKLIGDHFSAQAGYTVYVGAKKADSVVFVDAQTLAVPLPRLKEPGTVDVTLVSDLGPAYVLEQALTLRENAKR